MDISYNHSTSSFDEAAAALRSPLLELDSPSDDGGSDYDCNRDNCSSVGGSPSKAKKKALWRWPLAVFPSAAVPKPATRDDHRWLSLAYREHHGASPTSVTALPTIDLCQDDDDDDDDQEAPSRLDRSATAISSNNRDAPCPRQPRRGNIPAISTAAPSPPPPTSPPSSSSLRAMMVELHSNNEWTPDNDREYCASNNHHHRAINVAARLRQLLADRTEEIGEHVAEIVAYYSYRNPQQRQQHPAHIMQQQEQEQQRRRSIAGSVGVLTVLVGLWLWTCL